MFSVHLIHDNLLSICLTQLFVSYYAHTILPSAAHDVPQVKIHATVLMVLTALKRKQLVGPHSCAKATIEVYKSLIGQVFFCFQNVAELIRCIKLLGVTFQRVAPSELVIGNVVRRILCMIREEYAAQLKKCGTTTTTTATSSSSSTTSSSSSRRPPRASGSGSRSSDPLVVQETAPPLPVVMSCDEPDAECEDDGARGSDYDNEANVLAGLDFVSGSESGDVNSSILSGSSLGELVGVAGSGNSDLSGKDKVSVDEAVELLLEMSMCADGDGDVSFDSDTLGGMLARIAEPSPPPSAVLDSSATEHTEMSNALAWEIGSLTGNEQDEHDHECEDGTGTPTSPKQDPFIHDLDSMEDVCRAGAAALAISQVGDNFLSKPGTPVIKSVIKDTSPTGVADMDGAAATEGAYTPDEIMRRAALPLSKPVRSVRTLKALRDMGRLLQQQQEEVAVMGGAGQTVGKQRPAPVQWAATRLDVLVRARGLLLTSPRGTRSTAPSAL